MKSRYFITYLCLIFSTILFSCSNDDSSSITNDSLVSNLKKVQTFTNNSHEVELFTDNGLLLTGYNKVYIRIKNFDGNYIEGANITWQPTMHMAVHTHGSPFSDVVPTTDLASLYSGYIIFQMASNDTEYWELQINYTINNVTYQVSEKVEVSQASNRNVQTFTGTDNVKYVLALVEPTLPKVAVNNISALLYKMQSMSDFKPVNNYTIKIDPRMPSMGNHSSPNNVNLTQGSDSFYYGKLSLTMTGYWQINLQVFNATNELIKGEAITEDILASSIYFDIEF